MKHITKYILFENHKIKFDSIEHIRTIKDIFQDIIDEYDVYATSAHNTNFDSNIMSYNIEDVSTSTNSFLRANNIQIVLRFDFDGPYRRISSKIKKDIRKEISRLELLGYKILQDSSSDVVDYWDIFYINCYET